MDLSQNQIIAIVLIVLAVWIYYSNKTEHFTAKEIMPKYWNNKSKCWSKMG